MKEIRFSGEKALFSLSAEPDGSGDFLVAVEAEVEGFSGHADGHVVGDHWKAFMESLRQLEKTRKGSALLESAAPGEFEVLIRAVNGRGHMGISGALRYCVQEERGQRLEFSFEFDPSQLMAAAK